MESQCWYGIEIEKKKEKKEDARDRIWMNAAATTLLQML